MTRGSLISRRTLLFGRIQGLLRSAKQDAAAAKAVIQGRHCLAYRHLTCTVCHERCPETGAITMQTGTPRVNPDRCTGCGICRDVCPAPTNAVLMIHPTIDDDSETR